MSLHWFNSLILVLKNVIMLLHENPLIVVRSSTYSAPQEYLQGDQLYMAVCFWYLVKSHLSSVRGYSSLHWPCHFLQGIRKKRPCLNVFVRNTLQQLLRIQHQILSFLTSFSPSKQSTAEMVNFLNVYFFFGLTLNVQNWTHYSIQFWVHPNYRETSTER